MYSSTDPLLEQWEMPKRATQTISYNIKTVDRNVANVDVIPYGLQI